MRSVSEMCKLEGTYLRAGVASPHHSEWLCQAGILAQTHVAPSPDSSREARRLSCNIKTPKFKCLQLFPNLKMFSINSIMFSIMYSTLVSNWLLLSFFF